MPFRRKVSDTTDFMYPPECPTCRGASLVALEQVISKGTILLFWACRFCQHSWPASRHAVYVPRPTSDGRALRN